MTYRQSKVKKYVTVKDIAAECGVSATTVSLALRNHPKISENTKQRIREASTRMGYRRNPMISALMSNLKQPGSLLNKSGIAAVYSHKSTVVNSSPYHRNLWDGISRRAEELGLSIDRFYLGDMNIDSKQITQILLTRGITGIIIPPGIRAGSHLSIDWESFSAITIGYSVYRPNIHRVCQDQYQAMRLAMRKLYRYGYHRPGLVLTKDSDLRSLHLWSSGFYGSEHLNKKKNIIPLFEYSGDNNKQLLNWYKKYQPDVIIASSENICHTVNRIGIKCPEDIGLILLGHAADSTNLAGIEEQEELTGKAAVEWLSQLLYYNERGIPDVPQTVQIPPSWIEGASLPNHNIPKPNQLPSPLKK